MVCPHLIEVPSQDCIKHNVQQEHLEDSCCTKWGLTVDRQVQGLSADAALC